ncbi:MULTISPECIES: copper resistance protein CopC [unclassified Agrococcus]|uniref:copper resistance CopC family protein n=1 Tax=unclassified Agrococcus TaxID=2615065 RepID=UPI00360E4F85
MTPLLALAAAGAALVLPLPAHATIVGTNPEDGGTIAAAPEAFTVTANEEILSIDGGSSNVILITDQAGLYYGSGCATVEGATLSTTATLGEPGVYTMRYGLVSADGHPIEGVVDFAYEPGGDAAAVPGAETAPECGAAQPEPSASPSAEPTAAPEPSEGAGATSEPPSSSTAPSTSPSGDESSDGSDDEGGIPSLAYVGIGLALLAGVATVLVITWRRGRRRELGAPDEPAGPDAR